jgi:hypothetical protein
LSDLEEFKADILPLTGQNLIDVPHDGSNVKTVIFRADLSRRPDVLAWLRYQRKWSETQTLASWACRADSDPQMALLIVTAEKPQACRFVVPLDVADANGWRWIERIAMAGFVGLTDRKDARSPTDLLMTMVMIPFSSQPLNDFLEAVR